MRLPLVSSWLEHPNSSIEFVLVMTNSLPWKINPFLIGKPSISMGHLYHGYVSHNQRVVRLVSIAVFDYRRVLVCTHCLGSLVV